MSASRPTNLFQVQNDIFRSASLLYPESPFELKKVLSVLQNNLAYPGTSSIYSSILSLIGICLEMRLNFSGLLSVVLRQYKNLGINPDALLSIADENAISDLDWLIHIKDFEAFCNDALEILGHDWPINDPECDSNRYNFLKLRLILPFIVDQVRNIDTLPCEAEKVLFAKRGINVYGPFASMLGFEEFSNEIEDCSFRMLDPYSRNVLTIVLQGLFDNYRFLIENLKDELKQIFFESNIPCRILWRQKSPYSVWSKMINKGRSFCNIQDVWGLRIVLERVEDCYKVLDIMHSRHDFIPRFCDDFISTPKPNGYRSIHTVILLTCKTKVEVQIRTNTMEHDSTVGSMSHWFYKKNGKGANKNWIESFAADDPSWIEFFKESVKNFEIGEAIFRGA